jgi:hypothetical protein
MTPQTLSLNVIQNWMLAQNPILMGQATLGPGPSDLVANPRQRKKKGKFLIL